MDCFWDPCCFHIVLEEILFQFGNFNEPGSYSFINQRSITSPTERIIMFLLIIHNNSSLLLKILNNYPISLFNINTFISRYLFSKLASLIKWNWWIIRSNKFLFQTYFIIILTKSRCTMYNPRTNITSNKITSNNFKTSIFFSIQEKLK